MSYDEQSSPPLHAMVDRNRVSVNLAWCGLVQFAAPALNS